MFKLIINPLTFLLLISWLAMSAGCSDDSDSREKVVTGTIDFAEQIDLGSLVKAHVELIDYTMADAPAIVISEEIIEPIEELPISFSVTYFEDDIDPRYLYSISAEVYELNNLSVEERAFITTQTNPVLTNGFGNEVNVIVERVN